MSIIEELYNGDLCPVENMVPQNPDYRQICRMIGNEREYFEGILSDADRERFKKWNELVYEYEKMVEFANFSNGFKLGMQLGCEVFGQEEDLERSLEEKAKGIVEEWSLQKKGTEVP